MIPQSDIDRGLALLERIAAALEAQTASMAESLELATTQLDRMIEGLDKPKASEVIVRVGGPAPVEQPPPPAKRND